jgi:DNA-binding IclR family transcriptional regulator
MVILSFLATRVRPVPAAVVAARCGLPRSSTYNLLYAMRSHGFVAYHEELHGWSLGAAAFEVAASPARPDRLVALAQASLERLAADAGAPAELDVLRGGDAVRIATAPRGGRDRLPAELRHATAPAHLSATGRAMLMHLSRAQICATYPVDRPLSRQGGSPRFRFQLERLLALERARGWTSQRDGERATTCVGAPVLSHSGQPVAAVGVALPGIAPSSAEVDAIAPFAVAAATQVSALLGWTDRGCAA